MSRRGSRFGDIVTVALAIVWLLPLIFSILMSVRPEAEPVSNGNIFFGSRIILENFHHAWSIAPWPLHYVNTLIFVFGTLLVQILTITPAAYAFARIRFFGRGVLLFAILL